MAVVAQPNPAQPAPGAQLTPLQQLPNPGQLGAYQNASQLMPMFSIGSAVTTTTSGEVFRAMGTTVEAVSRGYQANQYKEAVITRAEADLARSKERTKQVKKKSKDKIKKAKQKRKAEIQKAKERTEAVRLEAHANRDARFRESDNQFRNTAMNAQANLAIVREQQKTERLRIKAEARKRGVSISDSSDS